MEWFAKFEQSVFGLQGELYDCRMCLVKHLAIQNGAC